MVKGYVRRYCDCKEWEEAKDDKWDVLKTILERYPDQCPYCHEVLKSESTVPEVRVLISFVNGDPYAYPKEIPLSKLKELLAETP